MWNAFLTFVGSALPHWKIFSKYQKNFCILFQNFFSPVLWKIRYEILFKNWKNFFAIFKSFFWVVHCTIIIASPESNYFLMQNVLFLLESTLRLAFLFLGVIWKKLVYFSLYRVHMFWELSILEKLLDLFFSRILIWILRNFLERF